MKVTNEAITHLPKGFLLGAAISAHQTEGNNFFSDWWHYEQLGRLPKSGIACDHYRQYKSDFLLAKEIGLNALRISIEWARVMPKAGEWDEGAILHYRDVLETLKSMGFKTFVTLHHFTLPDWLAQSGGFLNPKAGEYFEAYSRKVVLQLGDLIDFLTPFNESGVFAYMGYGQGTWPPFLQNMWLVIKIQKKLINLHKQVYRSIKLLSPNLPIGPVENLGYFQAKNKYNPVTRVLAWVLGQAKNRWLLYQFKGTADFFGLNYYFHHVLELGRLKESIGIVSEREPRSDIGWHIYPKGLYWLLKSLKPINVPIYITENGLADAQDRFRHKFIEQHLEWLMKAREEGVDVRGYLHWSLIDNFEWAEGFEPRFGLIAVDYKTQERTIRPSAQIFKEIKADL